MSDPLFMAAGKSAVPSGGAAGGPAAPRHWRHGASRKHFPGVMANDRVTPEVLPGEIHALPGKNGAGKTTFCNALTGLYRTDEGYVDVPGEPARLRSPRDAHEAGIFMVHQHFRLVQPL